MNKIIEQLKNYDWLRSWRPFFVIFVLGFLLYSQTLFFNLTYLDDNTLILDRHDVLSDIRNIGSIFTTDAFFSGTNFYYRPFLNLSFMLDAHLGGDSLMVYHLANILLHIIAVCLLFVILKKILNRKSLALFLALIFLVHPALTQAVAWLPGRNDSLVAIFILASFLCLLNFFSKPRLISLIGYSLFFLIALLTKETAIFFPFLVIIYLFTAGRHYKASGRDILLIILCSLSFGFIWYLMRSFAFSQENIGLGAAFLSIINNLPSALTMGAKMILPFNLSVLPVPADSSFWLSLIAWPAVIIALIFSRRKNMAMLLFGLAWFLIFFIPPFAISSAAPYILEHRLYLPLIGFLILVSEIDWVKNLDFNDKKTKIICVVIILLFSTITVIHSQKFSDRLTFWTAAANDSPHSPLAQRNLGVMYYLDGQLDLAAKYYNKALELSPNEAMVHNNLGLIYLDKGNLNLAEKEFKNELALYPDYDKALLNLGDLYYREKKVAEAQGLWQSALNANPNNSEAYSRLLNLQNRLK
jgi:tetratricopeptide (TPR) repeat protein